MTTTLLYVQLGLKDKQFSGPGWMGIAAGWKEEQEKTHFHLELLFISLLAISAYEDCSMGALLTKAKMHSLFLILENKTKRRAFGEIEGSSVQFTMLERHFSFTALHRDLKPASCRFPIRRSRSSSYCNKRVTVFGPWISVKQKI